MPKMGIHPTDQEAADFIALFRYIAYLIGAPNDGKYWADITKAKATFESMVWYELVPNETSKILAQNFIKWIEDQPPAYLSMGFMQAACRWMNGEYSIYGTL